MCSQALFTMLKATGESTLPAVKEKYSHSKCLRVSNFTFENLVLEEDGLASSQMEMEDV